MGSQAKGWDCQEKAACIYNFSLLTQIICGVQAKSSISLDDWLARTPGHLFLLVVVDLQAPLDEAFIPLSPPLALFSGIPHILLGLHGWLLCFASSSAPLAHSSHIAGAAGSGPHFLRASEFGLMSLPQQLR
jgi:hypothetical protein